MLKDAIELIQTVIADLQTPLAAGTVTYLHAGNLAPNGIPLLLSDSLDKVGTWTKERRQGRHR